MKTHILLIFILLTTSIFAQTETDVVLETSTGDIKGKLLLPKDNETKTVVLIISGSGPTDMDGNNEVMKNNSLKMVAEELQKNGIASLRFDKRGVGKSQHAIRSEKEMRFDDYVQDVQGWVDLLAEDERFEKLVILGHSEGSLLGAVASQSPEVDKFISVAGAGRPAVEILKEQMEHQPDEVKVPAFPILDELAKGNLVDSIPPILFAVFRPSVQPYIISWFKYDPVVEFSKLKQPILIIQGTTDIQIGLTDAEKLLSANKNGKLMIIEGMNHVLKELSDEYSENVATYNNPTLKLNDELMEGIVEFIVE